MIVVTLGFCCCFEVVDCCLCSRLLLLLFFWLVFVVYNSSYIQVLTYILYRPSTLSITSRVVDAIVDVCICNLHLIKGTGDRQLLIIIICILRLSKPQPCATTAMHDVFYHAPLFTEDCTDQLHRHHNIRSHFHRELDQVPPATTTTAAAGTRRHVIVEASRLEGPPPK